ncbi:MAG: peptidoglycan DD-metalloendopeptidase family protein [Rikenellaceae bacterium]|nr:peptidoglycan DD-metalloendopeptidase family protein [Rikenellaceae bacterium]
MKKKNLILIGAALAVVVVVLVAVFALNRSRDGALGAEDEAVIEEPAKLYGIVLGDHEIEQGEIQPGDNLSEILGRYGIGARAVDSLVRASEGVFDIRSIRGGQPYHVFLTADSLRRLDHFVYQRNNTDYVVFNFVDSITIRLDSLPVRVERRMASGTIESSLWSTMVGNGYSPALALTLSDIYAWTIDFFGLQKGDAFEVIYEDRFVDTLSVGHGQILGAWFEHNGKRYNAIPYDQSGKITFWDEAGNSLRKSMLKAPLVYSRISSRFSNSRLHPILKTRRAHHGVDYAAPSGTEVVAVADGTVTRASYDSGGGNTVRIKHARNLETGYLHLSKYGPGIKAGVRVTQGQVIGYVGSTGLSTGPHLDYRVWQGGTAIDPLKVPTEPAEPIDEAHRAEFDAVARLVLSALEGTTPIDSIRLTISPDSIHLIAPTASADSGLDTLPAER